MDGGDAEEESSEVEPVQIGDIVYLKDSGSFDHPANLVGNGALKRCCVHAPTAAHKEVGISACTGSAGVKTLRTSRLE